jgi:hypothetical protein
VKRNLFIGGELNIQDVSQEIGVSNFAALNMITANSAIGIGLIFQVDILKS